MREEDNPTLPFWDHVEELRRTLLKIFFTIGVGVCFSLFFFETVFSILCCSLNPSNVIWDRNFSFREEMVERVRVSNASDRDSVYHIGDRNLTYLDESNVKRVDENSLLVPPGAFFEYDHIKPKSNLVLFSPTEGIRTILSTSLWTGFMGTSPVWLYFILRFISPALGEKEKKQTVPFLALSLIFLFLGFLFAFFITIPLANGYLGEINERLGQNLWSLSHYLNYALSLLFANGIAFETCVILLFLVHSGRISVEKMRKCRRHAIVIIFIASAVLTPPDVLTQILLAIPLMAIYEGTIFYASLRACSKSSISRLNDRKSLKH